LWIMFLKMTVKNSARTLLSPLGERIKERGMVLKLKKVTLTLTLSRKRERGFHLYPVVKFEFTHFPDRNSLPVVPFFINIIMVLNPVVVVHFHGRLDEISLVKFLVVEFLVKRYAHHYVVAL